MQKQVHRLERVLSDRDKTIKELSQTNSQLTNQVEEARRQIENLKDKAVIRYSYDRVPEHEIVKTLECKVASSAWNIAELQRTNKKLEATILKMQSQILDQQQQIMLKKFTFHQRESGQDWMINEDPINEVFQHWQKTIKQKQALIEQNLALKENIKNKDIQITQKIGFYLNEVYNLNSRIKNQQQKEKSRFNQFEAIVREIKGENQDLRNALKIKNQHILMFYQDSKIISTTKAADLHTIRNLRAEIKKNGQRYFKILSKLEQSQQIKNLLSQKNDEIDKNMSKFDQLDEELLNNKKQNGILKQKLSVQQKKNAKHESLVEEVNKKLYQVLVENEACHELLYQARGYSNLFMKDVQAKIERFLRAIDKRRQNCESWVDVTQLITVNQKLRMRSMF